MSYDLNYVKYLSGMITESQLRGDEPINELFGDGVNPFARRSSATEPLKMLTKSEITSFLKDMAAKAAQSSDDTQSVETLHQDVERVCADIEEIMARAQGMEQSSDRSGGTRPNRSIMQRGRERRRSSYTGINPNAFR